MSEAGEGHNSKVGGIAGDRLLSIIERHEHLENEVKVLREDQKEILVEARSAGYDVKIVRHIMRLRKLEPNKLQEQDALIEVYRHAVGL